jgi:hypothetical protein
MKVKAGEARAPMIATWMKYFPGAIGRLEMSSGK